MSNLLEGKHALILGVANKWSLAYAIAQAYRREGAELTLTYQSDRLKLTVEELGHELSAEKIFQCDVSKDAELDHLTSELKSQGALHSVVHAIAFANREDLDRPFLETSRAGYLLAQEVSSYSLVSVARATAPRYDRRRLPHHSHLPRLPARPH